MAEVCPNCGSDDWYTITADMLGGTTRILQACKECGQLTNSDGKPWMTPRRSLPQTPLELPDGTGDWWQFVATVWMARKVRARAGFKNLAWLSCDGTWVECERGQWVRAIPPIVAKPVDADAEVVRDTADVIERLSELEMLLDRKLRASTLRRIADRLEREAKHG